MTKWRAAPLLACLAAVLHGCATPPQGKADGQQLQLDSWLPGHYDNRAQVASDRIAGRPLHPAVSIVIVHVDSLIVGEHVFYMQQSDTDDPQHITSQRVLSFAVVGNQIVETLYSLTDPARWRGAEADPQVFTGLQPPDLKMVTGCSLIWKKEGEKFTATNDKAHCHSTPAAAPSAISAQWQMELTADTLALSERAYDADDKLVFGNKGDPFLRLRKDSVTPP